MFVSNEKFQESDIYLIFLMFISFSQIYRDAFKSTIDFTKTFSTVLGKIKIAYENALKIRDERIAQFSLQDVSIISLQNSINSTFLFFV